MKRQEIVAKDHSKLGGKRVVSLKARSLPPPPMFFISVDSKGVDLFPCAKEAAKA